MQVLLLRGTIYFLFPGVGLGMAYLPAIVAVSFWFEKKRSLATGLAVCGSGIGTFLFAPLTQVLLNEYGWKGTVLIESAILLNCILCGALFRPVDPPPISTDEEMKPLNTVSSSTNDTKFLAGKTESNVGNKPAVAMSMPDVSGSESRSARKRVLSESHSKPPGSSAVVHLRKDAFYSGSLHNIPLYNRDKQEYHKSMTSVKEDDGDVSSKCFLSRCLPGNVRKECSEMMDITLLLDVAFLLFCISNLLTSIGFCVPYIFLPDRAMKMEWAQHGDESHNKQMSSFLISIVGISNTVGRVIFGWLADRKFVDRLMLYNTVLVLCGIISIASSLCLNYVLMAVYSALFGLFIGKLLIDYYEYQLFEMPTAVSRCLRLPHSRRSGGLAWTG